MILALDSDSSQIAYEPIGYVDLRETEPTAKAQVWPQMEFCNSLQKLKRPTPLLEGQSDRQEWK
jgi:hypothetical protein